MKPLLLAYIHNIIRLKPRYTTAVLLLLLSITALSGVAQSFDNLKSQKPFTINGGLEIRQTLYNANGIPNRSQANSYFLSGSATINIYNFSIPISATYSPSARSFSQPFNQFGVSPTYKWITLHAGYRNVEFSPYTLGGHTMLGGGLELKPGLLRFGFMYGRLNRATTVDTTTQALVPFSFSRKAIAVKLGLGTDRNFFEFSYLRARDDSTSVSRKDVRPQDYITPSSNDVLGYSNKFTFFKRLTFENRAAISVYTRDINSPISIDSVDSPILKKLKDLNTLNGTTEFYTALDASLTYRAKYYGLKVEYKRIDPEFKTMGSYFFNSDLESWTFGPSLSIFKNKVRISGNVGFQHDNLLNQKRTTNKRFIGSGNASIEISKPLAMDINYSNFSNDQQPNTVRFPDSLRIVQTTQNFTVSPRYTILKQSTMQVISASVNMNKLNDFNRIITSNSVSSSTIDTKQYLLVYTLNFIKKGIGLFINVNRTDLTSQTIDNTYQGVTLGGYGSFLKNKLQLNLNNSVIQGISKEGKSLIINTSGSANYKITRKQGFKYAFFFTSNNPTPGSSQKNYTELKNEISYLLNF
ncbi:hypothetical protein [Arcicella lustrica]|uniref:DUF5723 domain-containing protein n=1 Tax=Arcicella lustrica TaxID=2984196 RepID=A0ABU5SKY8_9BACT|nr:hypothetical protein [Arcicella sp. DC25W]MEA5427962.1 hypothetical protein [Arcicella sp. DC25W]